MLRIDGFIFLKIVYLIVFKWVYYSLSGITHPTRHVSVIQTVVMELEDNDCGHHWHANDHHGAGKVLTWNAQQSAFFTILVSYLKILKKEHQYTMHAKENWPIRGTESEVAGIISATISMKTVRDSRTVMPEGSRMTAGSRGLPKKQ